MESAPVSVTASAETTKMLWKAMDRAQEKLNDALKGTIKNIDMDNPETLAEEAIDINTLLKTNTCWYLAIKPLT